MNRTTLLERSCKPYAKGSPALTADQTAELSPCVPEWAVVEKSIVRSYTFRNYYETMAFVNALAYVAHREDHHPDLEVSYKNCKVTFSTHSVGGLSENDFICAAKIDALV